MVKDKEEILNELAKQFALVKKEFKFKSSYEDINVICSIDNITLSQGYVSNHLLRQIINRIIEILNSWIPEIYSWVLPQQMDMIHITESKTLSTKEKKELLLMIDRIMYLVRKNKRIVFNGLLKKEEANFIDELVEFYKKHFSPFMLKYHKKFEDHWQDTIDKAVFTSQDAKKDL